MELLSLYARKEPTADTVALNRGPAKKLDTVIYRDKECTQRAARWPWHFSNCPRRSQKRITLNCWPFQLIWLN